MKGNIALLSLPLILGVAIAQSKPPAAPEPNTSEVSSEAPAAHVYTYKDGVKPPKVLYQPDPKYPKEARRSRQQGTVGLSIVVGPDGHTRDIKVSRTLSPEFDAAAIEAVKKWKFLP